MALKQRTIGVSWRSSAVAGTPNSYGQTTMNPDIIHGNQDIGVPEWTPPTRPAEQPPQAYPSPLQANVPHFDETAPQPMLEREPRAGADL